MLARLAHLLRMQPPVIKNRGLLFSSGATVPTDGTDGYQVGALFQHTDGGNNTAVYVNEGSVTSCEFNALTTGGPADVLTIGAFASLVQGSGIALSSTQTSSIVAYGDDAGAAIASNVYNIRSRLLLTVDQDGASIRALMGQLKLADGVDVSTGVYTASQGYVELAGDHSAETGSTFSCFDASVEIASGKTLTVDSGGEFCGVHVETTGTGSISNSGTCAGILIDKASGAPSWPIGLYIVGATTLQAIAVGAQDTGCETTTAYPFAVEVHNEANADIVAGATGSSAGIYNRYAIEAAQTSQCNHISVLAKLRVKANLADGIHVGVYGLVEQSAGAITGTSTTLTAAGHFVLDISPTNISTGHLNGICIDSSVANGGTMNATMAGLRLKKKSGAYRAWVTGIQLEDGATTTGLAIGTCVTGISIGIATGAALHVTGKWGDGYNTAGILIAADQSGAALALGATTAGYQGIYMNLTATVTGGENLHGIYTKLTTAGAMADGYIIGHYSRVTLAHKSLENYAMWGRMIVTAAQAGDTSNQFIGVFGSCALAGEAHALLATGGAYGVLGTASIASSGTLDQPLIGGYFECNAVDSIAGLTCASRHRMIGYCDYGVDVLVQTNNHVAAIRIAPEQSAVVAVGISFEVSAGSGKINHIMKFEDSQNCGVNTSGNVGAAQVSDAIIKIDIAGTDYYLPAFTAGNVTGNWADN